MFTNREEVLEKALRVFAKMNYEKAVSYTHLDVYKRQQIFCAMEVLHFDDSTYHLLGEKLWLKSHCHRIVLFR